jgi:hypothetical protein
MQQKMMEVATIWTIIAIQVNAIRIKMGFVMEMIIVLIFQILISGILMEIT